MLCIFSGYRTLILLLLPLLQFIQPVPNNGRCEACLPFLLYFVLILITNLYNLSQGTSLEYLSGDDLWSKLEESPYCVKVPQPVKEIFKIMGFDNILSLKQFRADDSESSDFKNMEQFMRQKLPKILTKKYEAISDLDKQLEKYYGIFSFCPEEYEVVQGFRYSIVSASSAARQLLFKASRPEKLHSSDKVPSLACSSEPVVDSSIVNGVSEKLSKTLTHWMSANASQLMDCDDINESVIVSAESNGRQWKASALCPVEQCSYAAVLHRTGTSWNTRNFYRHIENTHLKSSHNSRTSNGQQSIKTMLSPQSKLKRSALPVMKSSKPAGDLMTTNVEVHTRPEMNKNAIVQVDESSSDGDVSPAKKKRVNKIVDSDSEDFSPNVNNNTRKC